MPWSCPFAYGYYMWKQNLFIEITAGELDESDFITSTFRQLKQLYVKLKFY